MTDPFVAEIRIMSNNFAPQGWAWCNGQLLPISQNTALFSLLGTTYGGNGQTNFALPDLQGRLPLQPGQGPGLSLYDLGQTGGSDTVTLIDSEMPQHAHTLSAAPNPATTGSPSPSTSLARSRGGNAYTTQVAGNLVPMAPQMIAPAGGGLPHNNLMPYLTLYFNIALQGVFPPRT